MALQHLPHQELARFCQSHAVRELALFGSAVRDDFRDDSDVDVLVEFKPESRLGLVGFQQMRNELSRIFGRPVDLVTRSGLNRHIRDQVPHAARVIYAE